MQKVKLFNGFVVVGLFFECGYEYNSYGSRCMWFENWFGNAMHCIFLGDSNGPILIQLMRCIHLKVSIAGSQLQVQNSSLISYLFTITNFREKNALKYFSFFFLSLLPHFSSVRSVMYKYLEKENEISFDKIFNQILGKYWCHFFHSSISTSTSTKRGTLCVCVRMCTAKYTNIIGSLRLVFFSPTILIIRNVRWKSCNCVFAIYRHPSSSSSPSSPTTRILQAICYLKTFAKMHQKNRFHI